FNALPTRSTLFPYTTHFRSEVEAATVAKLVEEAQSAGAPEPDRTAIGDMLFDLQSRIVRDQILSGQPRIDGRDTRTVRPISIRRSEEHTSEFQSRENLVCRL